MSELQAVTSASEPPLIKKLHALGRKLGTPVSGTFELTSGCNFNCKTCYIHSTNAGPHEEGELSAEEWLSIGKQAADAGTVFVLLTGGEPLSRRDFAEIYTGLKKLGLMISVNTNGALLTGDIAELLEKNPPMRLNISLYADNPEGYMRACGVNAYDTVIKNIRRMKNAGISVKLNVSFSEYNADRYREISALIDSLELHCQTSVYMYPPVRRQDPSDAAGRLTPEDAAMLRIRWDMLRGKNGQLKNTAAFLEKLRLRECDEFDVPDEGVRCRAGHTAYWIDSAGRMLMCGMIPLAAGSVPADGFDVCWQKTRALMKTVFMPPKCTACALRPVCCVCPAACYAETGTFSEAPQYLCRMSRRIALVLKQSASEETKNETE